MSPISPRFEDNTGTCTRLPAPCVESACTWGQGGRNPPVRGGKSGKAGSGCGVARPNNSGIDGGDAWSARAGDSSPVGEPLASNGRPTLCPCGRGAPLWPVSTGRCTGALIDPRSQEGQPRACLAGRHRGRERRVPRSLTKCWSSSCSPRVSTFTRDSELGCREHVSAL